MTQTMRERLARIVDPEAFRGFDRLMREAAALRYDDGEVMTERQAANIREDAPGCTRKAYAIVDAFLAEIARPDDAECAAVDAALRAFEPAMGLMVRTSTHITVRDAMMKALRA